MNKRKQKKLFKQLQDENPRKRYDAVLALGMTGDAVMIDPLDDVANLDDNVYVRNLAAKAVSTLQILEERRLDAAAGDLDDEILWPELAHERMLQHREVAFKEDEQRDWAYEASKKLEDMSAEEKRELREKVKLQREKEEKRAARRERRGFRIILWLAVSIAAMGLGISAWYVTSVTPRPESRQAVLENLQGWTEEQQATTRRYRNALALPETSCTTMREVGQPERPAWTFLVQDIGLVETKTTGGVLGETADEFSRVDPAYLEGLDQTLLTLESGQRRLEEYQANLDAHCDELAENTAEFDVLVWVQESDTLLISAERNAEGALEDIEQALAALEAESDSDTPSDTSDEGQGEGQDEG